MSINRLSVILVETIGQLLSNQNIVNYVGHDSNNPENANIIPSTIAPKGVDERILPYPFDITYSGDARSQVHVYFPQFDYVNNGHATKVTMYIDIVVNKDIWLVQQGTEKIIRPYKIADLIEDHFKDKITNVGKMHFIAGDHLTINPKYDCIRLTINLTEFF